ncbi:MAG: complex I subunit 5 family protein [Candidatus Hodarchaeota archaeon]
MFEDIEFPYWFGEFDREILLLIFLPLAGAFIEIILELIKGEKSKSMDAAKHIVAGIFAASVFGVAIVLVDKLLHDETFVYAYGGQYLSLDLLSAFFAAVFTFIGLAATLYSIYYMGERSSLGLYYALLLSLIAGLNTITLATDFFTLFIAWEAMVMAGYALVSFNKDTKEAVEASFKYFIMSGFGSLLVLYGMTILYGLTGTLTFSGINAALGSQEPTYTLYFATVLIVLGFGVTGSLVLLNQWLVDAHPAAPTPISAVLSGIVVKAGAYAIIRTLYTALPNMILKGITPTSGEVGEVLMILGIITMFEGNIMIYAQFLRSDIKDIKRILAYSTTVHLGLIMFAIGIGTTLGLGAGMFHIVSHSMGKALLFILAGVFMHQVHSRDLVKMKGIGQASPFYAAAFLVGVLSLAAVPPTAGFVSEVLIFLAAFQAEYRLLAVLAIINSMLALAGYLWLTKYIIFEKPSEEVKQLLAANPAVKVWNAIPIILLVLATIFIGIYPEFVMEPAIRAAESLTP